MRKRWVVRKSTAGIERNQTQNCRLDRFLFLHQAQELALRNEFTHQTLETHSASLLDKLPHSAQNGRCPGSVQLFSFRSETEMPCPQHLEQVLAQSRPTTHHSPLPNNSPKMPSDARLRLSSTQGLRTFVSDSQEIPGTRRWGFPEPWRLHTFATASRECR